MAIVIGLFGLLLAGSLVWVAVGQLNARRVAPTPSAVASASAGPQVLPIASVADFDPSADGGSNAENPACATAPSTTTPTRCGSPSATAAIPGWGA